MNTAANDHLIRVAQLQEARKSFESDTAEFHWSERQAIVNSLNDEIEARTEMAVRALQPVIAALLRQEPS